MNTPPAIAGLVLAAGASGRMGSDKALALYQGRTFLASVVGTAREAGIEQLAVVLGHHADEIRQAVDLSGVQVVVNAHYHLGQTSSLQAGLRALAGGNYNALVLCLVDHPAVSSSTVRELITAYLDCRAPVVVPLFEGRRGHPVIISQELFGPIQALNSDQGANLVIRQYQDRTRAVPVSDSGVVLDIDDPQMLAKLG